MANEKRLIDGDKLRGLKYEKVGFSDYREGWNDAIDTILTEVFSSSVNAVEVVRCKDCKHRGDDVHCPMCFEEMSEYDDGDGYTEVDYITHDRTTDDGFCDRGERRTDHETD